MQIKVNSNDRLDKVIGHESELSRSLITKLIKTGNVKINGVVSQKASKKVHPEDVIDITIPEPEPTDIKAADIPLSIIYQDKDILVIDKQNDIVVHPAIGHYDDTLVNAILFHVKDFDCINNELRPGIVHRIDSKTTGLLVVAKNQEALIDLQKQFKDRTISRKYKALVEGDFTHKKVEINAPIGRDVKNRQRMAVNESGKESFTTIEVEKQYDGFALVNCTLKTGRTHQIRVHLQYINHNVIGDNTYGLSKYKKYPYGQYLHAYELTLIHPRTKKQMVFNSPLPEEFDKMIKKLGE